MTDEREPATTPRELVRQALLDAIDWQRSLADAWPKGTPERQEAIDQGKAYRALMKRRYGSDETPWEVATKNATTVTLEELRRRNP